MTFLTINSNVSGKAPIVRAIVDGTFNFNTNAEQPDPRF